jgi:hypothetical protein
MAYGDFSLEALKEQFGLTTDEQDGYFARTPPAPVSEKLRQHLDEYVSLAVAIGTEKARSELIIAPVLLEVRKGFGHRISFFSGVEFNPDPDRGLRGVCDFVFSLSPEQLTIEAPVVTIVEAKNENLRQGINQCIAEMVAAQVFNRARGRELKSIFGAVTTGTVWMFLRLTGTAVCVDLGEYHISQVEQIVGILLAMLRDAAGHTATVSG